MSYELWVAHYQPDFVSRKGAKAQKVKNEEWKVKNYELWLSTISPILFHAKAQRRKKWKIMSYELWVMSYRLPTTINH